MATGDGPGGQTAAETYGERPVLAWIDKRALMIDARYQRSIETRASQRLIDYLKANFTWVKCLPLVITENGDGTYCVIDGQHRLEAVRDKGEIQDLPCYVIGEMTLQQQAMAFVDMNTHRVGVAPLAVHHAKSKGGDPEAREIDRVVDAAGCKVRRSIVPVSQMKCGQLSCISTVRVGIKKHGSERVILALRTIRQAWPDDGGIRAEILQATIDFLATHPSADLLARLQRRAPDEIMAQAYARRAMDRLRSLSAHVLAVITENRGRR